MCSCNHVHQERDNQVFGPTGFLRIFCGWSGWQQLAKENYNEVLAYLKTTNQFENAKQSGKKCIKYSEDSWVNGDALSHEQPILKNRLQWHIQWWVYEHTPHITKCFINTKIVNDKMRFKVTKRGVTRIKLGGGSWRWYQNPVHVEFTHQGIADIGTFSFLESSPVE